VHTAISKSCRNWGDGRAAPKIRLMTQTNFVPIFVSIILVFILFLLTDKILQNEGFLDLVSYVPNEMSRVLHTEQ